MNQPPAIRLLLLILAFQVSSISAFALEFAWVAPTNGTPQGYVLSHWAPGTIYEQYGVGLATNLVYQGTLVDGPNYFAVSDYQAINGELIMSPFSNIAVVTNTPALLVDYYLFSSTNLNGGWNPAQTNHLLIYPVQDCQFFQPGGANIRRTNIVTVQSNGMPPSLELTNAQTR
ncbi:MAG TPA: hypothetical protein VNN22_24155 [Verrucomicrobiae bacterium]|nr:hypothetical protein [Verrucomicrobiae bacterium]